VRYLNWSQKNF